MKKFLSLLCVILVLIGLIGCNEQKAKMQKDYFYQQFDQLLAPTRDEFDIEDLLIEIDEELNTTVHTRVFTDRLTGKQYELTTNCDSEGCVKTVQLRTEKGKYMSPFFAVLSYYVYSALDCPEIEPDDFYKSFNLLTAEPEGLMECKNHAVIAIMPELDTLCFYVVLC